MRTRFPLNSCYLMNYAKTAACAQSLHRERKSRFLLSGARCFAIMTCSRAMMAGWCRSSRRRNRPTGLPADTSHNLLRCAFHLGNRHTQTQVGEDFLRIYQDSVLREMLLGLGATVVEENAQFEPESGAYSGGGGHHHHGDDGHSHSHSHGPLAPIPVHQKIHRPTDSKVP